MHYWELTVGASAYYHVPSFTNLGNALDITSLGEFNFIESCLNWEEKVKNPISVQKP